MAPIRDRWSLAPTPAGRMPHRATRMWTAMRQAALYGWAAPARSETIHVDPRHIRARITPQLERQLVRTTGHEGGVIVDGDWDLERVTSREFTTTPVYRSCHAHWVEGVPWEETESVRMDLDRFVIFLQGHGVHALNDATRKHIVDFMMSEKDRGMATSTISRRLVSIKVFFRYLQQEGMLAENRSDAMDSPRLWKMLPDTLSQDEVL